MAEPIRYYLDQHVYGAVAHGLRQHGKEPSHRPGIVQAASLLLSVMPRLCQA